MSDLYRFSIHNNQIKSVQEWDDGRWEYEKIDADEHYYIEGDVIFKQETDDGVIELTSFTDINGDGIYSAGQTTFMPGGSHIVQDFYRFDIQNGNVISKTEYETDGEIEQDSIQQHQFTVQGNLITEYEPEGWGFEKTVYKDSNGDGRYQKIYEEYITGNNHQSYDQGKEIVFQSGQQDKFTLNPGDNVNISNFNADEGDQIILSDTFGIHSFIQLVKQIDDIDYECSRLEVKFENNTSVEFTGILTQDAVWGLFNFSAEQL